MPEMRSRDVIGFLSPCKGDGATLTEISESSCHREINRENEKNQINKVHFVDKQEKNKNVKCLI